MEKTGKQERQSKQVKKTILAVDDVPVFMVIPEDANKYVKKIYEAGALDFVRFPFDTQIVRRRIHNAILLSVKQKRMKAMVAAQIIEKEKNNTLMLAILSHIVEFRNGESGLHVLNINTLTELIPCQIHCMTFWGGGNASQVYVSLAGEIRLLTQTANYETENER